GRFDRHGPLLSTGGGPQRHHATDPCVRPMGAVVTTATADAVPTWPRSGGLRPQAGAGRAAVQTPASAPRRPARVAHRMAEPAARADVGDRGWVHPSRVVRR